MITKRKVVNQNGLTDLNEHELIFALTGFIFLPFDVNLDGIEKRIAQNRDALLNIWKTENLSFLQFPNEYPDFETRKKTKPAFQRDSFQMKLEFFRNKIGK